MKGIWVPLPIPGYVLTPVEAHRDKIRKRTGIEVVFTQSIIEYHIHGETCVLSNKFVQG